MLVIFKRVYQRIILLGWLLILFMAQVKAGVLTGGLGKLKLIEISAGLSPEGLLNPAARIQLFTVPMFNVSHLVKQLEGLKLENREGLFMVVSDEGFIAFTGKTNLLMKQGWLTRLCDSIGMDKVVLAKRSKPNKAFLARLKNKEEYIVVEETSIAALLDSYRKMVAGLAEQGKIEGPVAIAPPPPPGNNMNWIQKRSFGENETILGEVRDYYDGGGRPLQTQTRRNHRQAPNTTQSQIFAKQTLRDVYDRQVATTLPAPINSNEFTYKPDFVQNAAGGIYNYRNYDRHKALNLVTDKINNPEAVGGQAVMGTLGWYYSVNNNWEPYTPTTNYPFNRQSFYQDGSGMAKKSAGAGEAFKMGSGHEALSFITPVVSELAHYIQVRNKYFPENEIGALPASFTYGTGQEIALDASGKEAVIIADKGGNILFSARPGTGNSLTDLLVNNVATVGANEVFYFRIFSNNTTVSINGAGFKLYEMTGESEVSLTGNVLNKGYYKLTAGGAAATLNYANWYTDISYSFYDHLGQLVAAIAPEGVKKLLGTGINNYATRTAIPFIRLYEYDLQGRVVKSIDPDEGINEYVYRKDGQIRFSQDARQKVTGSYNYVNYDPFGRPVERGEYDGTAIAFTSDMTVSSPMKNIIEDLSATGGLNSGIKRDVVKTKYDLVDNSHGLTGYLQAAEFLGGGVSMTQKYTSITNNVPNSNELVSASWYNYDEEGKIVWQINYIQGLGYKTNDFTYDVVGNLVKRVFQKSATDGFVHYYEYDPVTHELWKIYTNTEDNLSTRKLQATYYYYLHGPLKRIELAGDLQGIDFTYTLLGEIKAINNCDKTKDPGGDGSNGFFADAFGMVLDYHSDDYTNARPGLQAIKGVNTTGIATDSYIGQIKAMSWFSKKPVYPGLSDNPTTYVYKYDDKDQLIESFWGNYTPYPNSFTATNFNKETIKHPSLGTPAYDANGNIQYLQRTNSAGNIVDRFSYSYQANTNKLSSITTDASGTAQTFSTYQYDQNGQLAVESPMNVFATKHIKYDADGRVLLIAIDPGFVWKIAEFVYNEMGERIIKKQFTTGGDLSSTTFYVEDVVYTQYAGGPQPAPKEYAIGGGAGRLGVYYKETNMYAYELNDHLGNVRAVVVKNGSTLEVRKHADYYPYGQVIPGYSGHDYRYGYQGQYAERDPETGWNAFELRMYDSRIGRWMGVDPQNEFWSPYVGMGNDPVNNTDPDGGCTKCAAEKYAQQVGGRVEKNPNGGFLVYYDIEGGVGIKKFNSNFNALDRVGWGVWVDRQISLGHTDAIMTMWLANEHLTPSAFVKYLDASSANAVRIRQAQHASWKMQGKIAEQIGWTLVPWGRIGAAGKFIASKIITSAGKHVMSKAISNPIIPRWISKLPPNLQHGAVMNESFFTYAKKNIVFRIAQRLKIIKFTQRFKRGADVEGRGILQGKWWDVTSNTAKEIDRHNINYGPGGTFLFY